MAFLVLLCVYIGSFLRGSFSCLTLPSAYTWPLHSLSVIRFVRAECELRFYITGEGRGREILESMVLFYLTPRVAGWWDRHGGEI